MKLIKFSSPDGEYTVNIEKIINISRSKLPCSESYGSMICLEGIFYSIYDYRSPDVITKEIERLQNDAKQ